MSRADVEQCAAVESSNTNVDSPNGEPIRGPLAIVFRMLLGTGLGGVLGGAVFLTIGIPLLASVMGGAMVGLVAGSCIGVFVWAIFPYKSNQHTNS